VPCILLLCAVVHSGQTCTPHHCTCMQSLMLLVKGRKNHSLCLTTFTVLFSASLTHPFEG
jgi:hypothetical protein